MSLVTIVVNSCVKKSDLKVIEIAPDNLVTICVDKDKVVELEASPKSMLFDINSLVEHNGRYYVHSRNYLRAFDSTSGEYLFSIQNDSLKGDKLNIGWLKEANDTMWAYDMNRQRMYLFDFDGNALAQVNLYASPEDYPGEKPRLAVPVQNGFFTVNFYTDHTTPTNPALTFYNSEGERLNAVAGRNVGEGTFLMDGYFALPDRNEMLYWEPLRDTIFIADSARIVPAYVINCGKNSFPGQYQNLPYAVKASIFTNNPKEEYLSLIRYVHDMGDNLWFTITSGEGVSYVCRYDKSLSKTQLYHFKSEDNKLAQTSFLSVTPDCVYLELRNPDDVEANPAICKIRLEDFGK